MVVRNDPEYFKHELKEITFFMLLGIIAAIILPLMFGFGFKTFAESFQEGRALQFGDFLFSYMIYYIMIFGALIGLPILKIREMYLTDTRVHPAKQQDPKLFALAYLHDPEQDGALYRLSEWMGFKGDRNFMRWSRSIFRMIIIFGILFAIVGVFQAATEFKFVDIPQSIVEVSKTAQVYLTMEPPSFAETMLMLFIFSILMSFNSWFCSKFKLGEFPYYLIGFFVCVLVGLFWMGFHAIVYGNDEAALAVTFIFGFIGSLLTLLFGTFIPWYMWHLDNNMFAKITEIAIRNEDVIFVSVALIVLALFLYVGGEVAVYKIRKRLRRSEVFQPPMPA